MKTTSKRRHSQPATRPAQSRNLGGHELAAGIGQRLQRVRLMNGLSVSDLAQLTGVSASTIRRIERAGCTPAKRAERRHSRRASRR